MYGCFVRNHNSIYRFSSEKRAVIKGTISTHLLSPFHNKRSILIAWAVSNGQPSNNNRKEFRQGNLFACSGLFYTIYAQNFRWAGMVGGIWHFKKLKMHSDGYLNNISSIYLSKVPTGGTISRRRFT